MIQQSFQSCSCLWQSRLLINIRVYRYGDNMRILFFVLLISLISLTPPAWAGCTVSYISIKSIKAKFIDTCKRSPCPSMKGVAVLTNHCSEPVGVEIKITAYDKSGNPVAARDLWPASTNNIPPGNYTFSLDQWLDYDPEIKTFELTPITIRLWR